MLLPTSRYCWIMSTFTLPKYWEGEPQKDGAFIHHGVGVDHDEDEKVYHAYYQWVPLMLSLQVKETHQTSFLVAKSFPFGSK